MPSDNYDFTPWDSPDDIEKFIPAIVAGAKALGGAAITAGKAIGTGAKAVGAAAKPALSAAGKGLQQGRLAVRGAIKDKVTEKLGGGATEAATSGAADAAESAASAIESQKPEITSSPDTASESSMNTAQPTEPKTSAKDKALEQGLSMVQQSMADNKQQKQNQIDRASEMARRGASVKSSEPMKNAWSTLLKSKPYQEMSEQELIDIIYGSSGFDAGKGIYTRDETSSTQEEKDLAYQELLTRQRETDANPVNVFGLNEEEQLRLIDFYEPQFSGTNISPDVFIPQSEKEGEKAFNMTHDGEFQEHIENRLLDIDEFMPGKTFLTEDNPAEKYNHLLETAGREVAENYLNRYRNFIMNNSENPEYVNQRLMQMFDENQKITAPQYTQEFPTDVSIFDMKFPNMIMNEPYATGYEHEWQTKNASEPMEMAWRLLKEDDVYNFSVNDITNTPRDTWYSQIMGRSTPMVDTLVDSGIMPALGYDNHLHGFPEMVSGLHEGDVSIDDSLENLMHHRNSLIVLDARMQGKEDTIPQQFRDYHNNFDLTTMMENEGMPPHIQAAQHLALLYSHLNYLGHKIGPQMGEPDDDFNMKYASEPMGIAMQLLKTSGYGYNPSFIMENHNRPKYGFVNKDEYGNALTPHVYGELGKDGPIYDDENHRILIEGGTYIGDKKWNHKLAPRERITVPSPDVKLAGKPMSVAMQLLKEDEDEVPDPKKFRMNQEDLVDAYREIARRRREAKNTMNIDDIKVHPGERPKPNKLAYSKREYFPTVMRHPDQSPGIARLVMHDDNNRGTFEGLPFKDDFTRGEPLDYALDILRY